MIMALLVMMSTVLTAFAASDGVQGKTYSYALKGDCSVDYGDRVYMSNYDAYTNKFTINGRIATCVWGTNPTPSRGTYKNATKYYLAKSDTRAKAFYWLYNSNNSAISANAKYKSASKTYIQDVNYALGDTGSSSGTYAFVHCVIDYLQQGSANNFCDDQWNKVVKAFAGKAKYYPNVPASCEVFYFYPSGTSVQSLMSWEEAPHGYFKIIKSSSNTSITNGNSSYSFSGIKYAVSKSQTDFSTSGSNYLGYISLNANGEGHSKDGSRATLRTLYPGTYYVKESSVPNNCSYKMNSTVYTITVTRNHTSSSPLLLRVSDIPKTCYGKIVKTSTKPELTNNNPDYSFEGIHYSFSKSSTDFSANGSNYIGYVELDKNGVGYTENGSRTTLRNLVPGTYYVKESYVPAGCKYKKDNTVYKMTFTFSNDRNNLKVMNVKDEPVGSSSAKITKKSSLPEISDGNVLYSYKGAEFTIYKTQTDAQNGTNPFKTVITDDNGVASIEDVDFGTYYVRETKAPYGFELSDEIKEIKLEMEQEEAYEVEFEDKPVMAQLSVLLQKRVAEGSEDRGLANAEYTVNYYNAQYDSVDDLAGIAPTRSWVFVTDDNGNIAYNADYQMSGDDLFYDSVNDSYGLPLGTITVQETKAPSNFYIDEQIYLSQITFDNIANVTSYNAPVSAEESIPRINITGVKTWDDDNDRDGKRPKSVTVELYRDHELFDSFIMSEETDWRYAFNDLEKGYADINLDNHFYEYQYDVNEAAVEYYESSTTELSFDGENGACSFHNKYVPERIKVSGTKTWEDYSDAMKYRPTEIKVILYQDGVKVNECMTSEEQNWCYSFDNLYKYHDHGIEYEYTVSEEAVPGYTSEVNGYNLKNTLATGSITLKKTDSDKNPLKGVSFKLFTEAGQPVASVSDGNTFHFSELTEDEEKATYVTDDEGTIVIDGLPIGKYYFKETETLLGFIPYGENIHFEIKENTINSPIVSVSTEQIGNPNAISVEAENARIVMPDTGGNGSMMFNILSLIFAGLSAMTFCLSRAIKSK